MDVGPNTSLKYRVDRRLGTTWAQTSPSRTQALYTWCGKLPRCRAGGRKAPNRGRKWIDSSPTVIGTTRNWNRS